MGEIPDAAAKCMHCGEWVKSKPLETASSLGQAANRYVSFHMVMSVIGLVIMLLLFLFVFLPGWNSARNRMDGPPHITFPAR